MTDRPVVHFRRVDPADGEVSRYQVLVTPQDPTLPTWIPGIVSSHRGTSGRKSGAYWLAYCEGRGSRVLRHGDVKSKPPMAFGSRKQAGDALVLHWDQRHRTDVQPEVAHG